MLSKSNIIIILILALCMTGLFKIKYRVLELKRDTKEMALNLEREKREINALKAEWAYLTSPERIATLTAKYLNLSQTTIDRLAQAQISPGEQIGAMNKKTKIINIAYKKSAGKWRYRKDQHAVTRANNTNIKNH